LFRFVFHGGPFIINNFSALFFKKGILFVFSGSIPWESARRQALRKTTTLGHKSQEHSPAEGSCLLY
jgi:hypothetical protein